MIRSKKASIGPTITWIVAVLVLAMGLAVMLVLAAGLFLTKKSVSVEEEKFMIDEALLTKKLIVFLDEPLSNGQTFREWVLRADEEGLEMGPFLFKQSAQNFIDSQVFGEPKRYESSWIRLYTPEEKVDWFGFLPSANRYSEYNAQDKHDVCNPKIEPKALVYFPVGGDKVIVLCANYNKNVNE